MGNHGECIFNCGSTNCPMDDFHKEPDRCIYDTIDCDHMCIDCEYGQKPIIKQDAIDEIISQPFFRANQ